LIPISRKHRWSRKRNQKAVGIRSILFVLGVIGILVTSFSLSSISGETTASVVYSRPWLIQLISKCVPGDWTIPYEGKRITNREVITSDVYYSGGSISHTSSPNAQIEFSFAGTEFEWGGFNGNNGGIVDVLIDGEQREQLDLYSNDNVKNVVYASPILESGNHLITIKATGKHNVLSQGEVIWVDYFNVLQGGKSQLFENEDSSIHYSHANEFYYYQFIIRKIAHVSLFTFCTLALMLFAFWVRLRRVAIWVVPIGMIVWAAGDEIHQWFVPGRTSSRIDFLLDTSGVMIGVIIYFLFISIQRCIHER
jgi:VanZ family protein